MEIEKNSPGWSWRRDWKTILTRNTYWIKFSSFALFFLRYFFKKFCQLGNSATSFVVISKMWKCGRWVHSLLLCFFLQMIYCNFSHLPHNRLCTSRFRFAVPVLWITSGYMVRDESPLFSTFRLVIHALIKKIWFTKWI